METSSEYSLHRAVQDLPVISADGSTLYCLSDRSGGLGATDIWSTEPAPEPSVWALVLWGGACLLLIRLRGCALTFSAASLLSVALTTTAVRAEVILGVPTNLGGNVNTSSFELLSSVSSDELTLYYNSPAASRDNNGPLVVSTRRTVEEIFGKPTRLDTTQFPVGSVVSISADSRFLYSSHSRRTQFGGFDLFEATRETEISDWTSLSNLGSVVNSDADEEWPFFTTDGLSLYFSDGRQWAGLKQRPDGMGGADIWVSQRTSPEMPWQPPENLGPIVNGPEDDTNPSVTSDGLLLFFVSRREGGYGGWDLWLSSREDVKAPWGAPVNLGPTVNGGGDDAAAYVSRDGRTLYMSSDRTGGVGGLDLWQIPLLEPTAVTLDGSGDTYQQGFDEALGIDGNATGINLPTGWTASDNGIVFESTTTKSFPAGSSLGRGTPIYNAGEDQHADRALAMGITDRSDGGLLQLLADVTEHDATSIQLQFDMEVWDAAKRNVDILGEAALDVTMELDTGDGFAELIDFGTVTTGAKFFPPAGKYLNGNADSNRKHFDRTATDVDIPAGSTLRIRWAANRDAQSTGWVYGLDNVKLSVVGDVDVVPLQAGDADQDLDFDQLDLVQVQVAAKYLTGQPATWGEGDWDGAPGGSAGSPPSGNGFFDQRDVVSALSAGIYLTGSYASVQPNGQVNDGQTSIIYNAGTGEMAVDAPAGVELTSINIDSAAGVFTGAAAANLGGSFDNDADNNIFKATFGGSFGSISFGNAAQAGLSEEFVLGDLTAVGSLAGGGDLGNVDLVYVPEPTSILLLTVGTLIGRLHFRRASRKD